MGDVLHSHCVMVRPSDHGKCSWQNTVNRVAQQRKQLDGADRGDFIHILLCRIYDETVEIVVALCWLCGTGLTNARLYSTEIARAALDFDRREEWQAEPAFCMELLKNPCTGVQLAASTLSFLE